MATPEDVSVSIITPCYNGERYLQNTLESALNQTMPAVELIVVDDGLTDGSAGIAERFGPPVRVIRQKNQGESVARNRALTEARGTHVLFLDADDLIRPDSLRQLATAVSGRPRAVALTGCEWFETDPARPYSTRAADATRFFPEIIESNFAPPHCWLAPRDLLAAAGGFCEGLHWFEDWDLWWRVGLESPTLIPVPYMGALYRRHQHSQLSTTSMADHARGHARVMARMVAAFLTRPALLEQHGDQLFWSAWTAVVRAREQAVGWSELAGLRGALRELAHRAPASVRAAWTARVVRFLGLRAALAVHASFGAAARPSGRLNGRTTETT